MSDKKNVPSHLSPYLNSDEELIWLYTDFDDFGLIAKFLLLFWILEIISAIGVYLLEPTVFPIGFLLWTFYIGLSLLVSRIYSNWRKGQVRDFYALTNQRIITFISKDLYSYNLSSVSGSEVRRWGYSKAWVLLNDANKPFVIMPRLSAKNAEVACELLTTAKNNGLDQRARELGLMD